jgi:hypothetical protein
MIVTQTKLEGPIAGDPFSMLGGFDLAAAGYMGDEYFLSGTAQSYALLGERGDDGCWSVESAATEPFATRILTRHPKDPTRFNGTVVVEWMNVTGGLDAAPDWLFMHRHLMREGAAWVGVSAQKAGIDGGGLVPGMPLKKANADRYGGLVHPGDAFSFDIFSQVGQALREEQPGALGAITPGAIERVIAVGESQSAGFLVSYVNAIDPLTCVFDGFMIHGRPATAAGIDGSYIRSSPDDEISQVSEQMIEPHYLRDEPRVPVLVLQSETDIITLGSGRARQPDSERLRLWEIAGAAHFDTYGLVASQVDSLDVPAGKLAALMAPTDKPMGLPAEQPINSGPQQHYIVNAAIAHLERQLRDGTPMPVAPRLESTPDASALVRDDLGIVKGGIRTPWVEAPSAVLSGLGQGGEGFMFLFGTTTEFDEATLTRLYPGGAEEHLARFDEAAADAHRQGFLLDADLEEIRALARTGRQPSSWSSD